MKTTPANDNLIDLVKKARKGTIVLPQFQRNFVWSRDDITGLLVSILEGHFIGTFLLLRTDSENIPFAMRPIQGVDLPQSQLRPDWMILDGQQRLTSLHYVFSAPELPLKGTKYPYRFFLDLNMVAANHLDKAISGERSELVHQQLPRERQFETLVIPCTEIEDWDDWLNQYEQWLVDRDRDAYFTEYFPRQKPAWNAIMARIHGFEVPTIEIPKVPAENPDRIAEVCAIFEKMNSTGVRLSVYDLLTARMYRFKDANGDPIDVHTLWEESVAEYPLLNQFSGGVPDDYGVYMLRTVALLRGLEVRSKSLVNLEHEGFVNDWRTVAAATEKALQRLTSTNDDGFGVFAPKWFPYSTMISPLAALIHLIDAEKLGHEAYALLRRWYWSSVFLERYAGAVETTIYQDFQDIARAARSREFAPRALVEARERIVDNPNYTLRDTSRVNATYRGIMCLIAIRGAKDLANNDAIEFHELDDHHIFPRAYLQSLPEDARPQADAINCILNRTLIASSTNLRISKSKPSTYLETVMPENLQGFILGTHFIDQEALSAMRSDDFSTFLAARERSLLTELRRRLTGILPG